MPSKGGEKLEKYLLHCFLLATAARMLCAIGTGGLDLLRGFNLSQRTFKFLLFSIAYCAMNIRFELAIL